MGEVRGAAVTKRVLEVTLPFLPPSENKIRVHRWQGGQVYSKEAKDFKRMFLDYIRENYFLEVSSFAKGHSETDMYELEIHFTFETVVNKGWYKKRAKNLYKRFDVGNRRKLIEDCLVEALGSIDDSLFFRLVLTKKQGPKEQVTMVLRSADPKYYGVLDVSRPE